MDLGQQIGANLKQLRTERGLTLGQLSSLAGISKAMLSELEKGNANPTINTLWKIARKCGCSVAEIISLNRELIRKPALIYPGWELKIPQD